MFFEDTSGEIELLEIPVQEFMIGKTLAELQLPDKFKVVISGIIKDSKLNMPNPQEKLQEGERLLVIGSSEDVEKMIEESK